MSDANGCGVSLYKFLEIHCILGPSTPWTCMKFSSYRLRKSQSLYSSDNILVLFFSGFPSWTRAGFALVCLMAFSMSLHLSLHLPFSVNLLCDNYFSGSAFTLLMILIASICRWRLQVNCSSAIPFYALLVLWTILVFLEILALLSSSLSSGEQTHLWWRFCIYK